MLQILLGWMRGLGQMRGMGTLVGMKATTEPTSFHGLNLVEVEPRSSVA